MRGNFVLSALPIAVLASMYSPSIRAEVIDKCGENAWSYRSDWAVQNSKAAGRGPRRFTTTG